MVEPRLGCKPRTGLWIGAGQGNSAPLAPKLPTPLRRCLSATPDFSCSVRRRVNLDPGNSWRNSTDESFNGKFRNECLSLEWFRNRTEAKIGIERWRRHNNEESTSPDGPAERERTRPPMVRCYAVFNVEQADGLTLERRDDDRDNELEWQAHQTAERVIQESGVPVRHERGDRAYYHLQTDRVTLPEREQSATANGYYQTALHELGHATGHPARMDRDTLTNGVGNFGSTEYAREEHRAEISAMIVATLRSWGIEVDEVFFNERPGMVQA